MFLTEKGGIDLILTDSTTQPPKQYFPPYHIPLNEIFLNWWIWFWNVDWCRVTLVQFLVEEYDNHFIHFINHQVYELWKETLKSFELMNFQNYCRTCHCDMQNLMRNLWTCLFTNLLTHHIFLNTKIIIWI